MKNARRTALLVIAVLLFGFAAACGSAEKESMSEAASGNAPKEAAAEPAAEKPKEKVTVKFSEVIRSIFYAPHYIAMSKGFFEEEGLNVDMNTSQGSDKGAAALIAGTADISLVGPETAIYIYNQKGSNTIKIFHQLTMKDGSFLLSREKMDAFDWNAVAGKKIIGWRPGSAPQMVMNSTLNLKGIKAGEVVSNIAPPAMAGAFASGQGDFIQLFEPVASTLEKEGKAFYAASMGEAFGAFPETSYVATSEFIEKNPDTIQGFVNAVAKGAEWLKTASDDEIAEALAPFFEGTSKELIIQSITRYKNQDTWPDKPELTAESFEKLQGVLVENGVLKEGEKVADMNEVVDMSFVDKIGKE